MKKYTIAALLILSISFVSFGAFAYEIMDAGLIIDITSPENGTIYDVLISDFTWSLLYNSSALSECNYTLNGAESTFDCTIDNVSISSAQGWNELNLSVVSLDAAALESVYFFMDTEPPQFTNEIHPANPITYLKNRVYTFSVDVTDAGSGVASVWIEFDGANKSVINVGDTYTFVISDLGVGTYAWKWFAVDNLGNSASLGYYYYMVTRANPSPGMNINLTTPITYGTMSDAIGFETNEGDADCVYTLSPGNAVYGVDASPVGFTYSNPECENYTSGLVSRTLTVNPAPSTTNVSVNPASPIEYRQTSNFDCSSSAGLDLVMEINLVDRTSEMGIDMVRGAGAYEVVCTSISNANYTGDSAGTNYTINKASQTAVLVISPGSIVTYGTAVNADCNGTLYRNDIDVSSEIGADVVLGAGNYSYSCKLAENQNYTFSEDNGTVVVNQADPLAVGDPVLSLIFSPSNSVYDGTETNVTGAGCPSQLACTLYRNESAVNNSDIVTLALGVWPYRFEAIGNENYTGANVTGDLSVVSPPSSGGGGGGGGSSSHGSCFGNWTCTEWSACIDEEMTRTCTVNNDICPPRGEKPIEIQACIVGGSIQANVSGDEGLEGSGITGAAIGEGGETDWMIIVAVVAGLGIAYGVIAYRRRSIMKKASA